MADTDPQLAQKIRSLSSLTIDLPKATSRLVIEAVDPRAKIALSVNSLKIQSNTRVSPIAYSSPQRLSLCLAHYLPTHHGSGNHVTDLCQASKQAVLERPDQNSIGTLALSPGSGRLKVSVNQATLPELGIQADASDTSLTLQYQPDSSEELTLPVLSPFNLDLDLAEPSTPKSSLITEVNQALPKFLPVKNLTFVELPVTETVDEPTVSTILTGKIRMLDQVLNLQEDQFLTVKSPVYNSVMLRYIRIHPEKPVGLQTLFGGRGQGIEVGLFQDAPLQRIFPGLLSVQLRTVAFSFLGGSFVYLLTKLFESYYKTPENNEKNL